MNPNITNYNLKLLCFEIILFVFNNILCLILFSNTEKDEFEVFEEGKQIVVNPGSDFEIHFTLRVGQGAADVGGLASEEAVAQIPSGQPAMVCDS